MASSCPAYASSVLGKPWYLYIRHMAQIVIQLGLTGVIAFYVAGYLSTGCAPSSPWLRLPLVSEPSLPVLSSFN